MDTPAQVDSRHAPDAAKHETSHEADFVPYPPSNPTKNCHADKDTELVHILPTFNDGERVAQPTLSSVRFALGFASQLLTHWSKLIASLISCFIIEFSTWSRWSSKEGKLTDPTC